jgi:two-component system chemotaxis response regulator CheY
MVQFILRQEGYDVVEAVDGQDGLEKAIARKADLVLTDQNMPRKDGISLIQALRALPQYRSVPILMLTTESGDEMKAKGRAAGATGWLVKPFDPNRLLDVVRKVIQ